MARRRQTNADWIRLAWQGRDDPSWVTRGPEGEFAPKEIQRLVRALAGDDDFPMGSVYDARGLPEGVRTVTKQSFRDPGHKGTFQAKGVFLDRDGVEIGTWERALTQRSDGSLLAIHAEMKLDREWQGRGIGPAFNERSEAAYRRLGVSQVALLANHDVGGFAWARLGFEFDDGSSWTGLENEQAAWDDEEPDFDPEDPFGLPGDFSGWDDPEDDDYMDSMDVTVDASYSGPGDVPTRMQEVVDDLRTGNGAQAMNLTDDEAEELATEIEVAMAGIKTGHIRPLHVSQIGRRHTWTETLDGREIEMWPGKAILLGSNWSGIRNVYPEPERFDEVAGIQSLDILTDKQRRAQTEGLAKYGTSTRAMAARFDKLFKMARERPEYAEWRDFYATAHDALQRKATRADIPFERLALATAALSPGNRWEDNFAQVADLADFMAEDTFTFTPEQRQKIATMAMATIGRKMMKQSGPPAGEAGIIPRQEKLLFDDDTPAVEQAVRKFIEERGERYVFDAERFSDLRDPLVGRIAWLEDRRTREGRAWGVQDYTNWDKAVALTMGYDPDEPMPPSLGWRAPLAKSRDVEPPLLSGIKVRSFYNNIAFPREDTGDVTVDVHMANAAARTVADIGRHNLLLKEASDAFLNGSVSIREPGATKGTPHALGLKPSVAEVLRRQARKHGLTPQEYQAVVWGMWRTLADPKTKARSTGKQGGSADYRAARARTRRPGDPIDADADGMVNDGLDSERRAPGGR